MTITKTPAKMGKGSKYHGAPEYNAVTDIAANRIIDKNFTIAGSYARFLIQMAPRQRIKSDISHALA